MIFFTCKTLLKVYGENRIFCPRSVEGNALMWHDISCVHPKIPAIINTLSNLYSIILPEISPFGVFLFSLSFLKMFLGFLPQTNPKSTIDECLSSFPSSYRAFQSNIFLKKYFIIIFFFSKIKVESIKDLF